MKIEVYKPNELMVEVSCDNVSDISVKEGMLIIIGGAIFAPGQWAYILY